jgi:hypothetical protein
VKAFAIKLYLGLVSAIVVECYAKTQEITVVSSKVWKYYKQDKDKIVRLKARLANDQVVTVYYSRDQEGVEEYDFCAQVPDDKTKVRLIEECRLAITKQMPKELVFTAKLLEQNASVLEKNEHTTQAAAGLRLAAKELRRQSKN